MPYMQESAKGKFRMIDEEKGSERKSVVDKPVGGRSLKIQT